MRKPNFIGIGIIHAGTGWLWRELNTHPQISLPKRKEINFFLEGRPINEYFEWFKDIPEDKVTGEFSVKYFQNVNAFERLKKEMPDANLFCVIRNPVDTAFSYYKGSRFEGNIPKATFLETMRIGYSNINIDKFKIADKLQKWTDTFNVKYFLYDDLLNTPVKYIRGVYEWLGVDSSFVSDTVRQWSFRPYHEQFGDRQVGDRARKELTLEYSEEVDKMEKLTGFDLRCWR